MIPQPGGVDTSKLRLANLQYMINVCAKFKYNGSNTVGGVHDTKLLVAVNRQTHRWIKGQDRLIPV